MISAVRANLPWRLNKTRVFVKHNLLSSWWRPGIRKHKSEVTTKHLSFLSLRSVWHKVFLLFKLKKLLRCLSWLLPLSFRRQQITCNSTGCSFSGNIHTVSDMSDCLQVLWCWLLNNSSVELERDRKWGSDATIGYSGSWYCEYSPYETYWSSLQSWRDEARRVCQRLSVSTCY